MQVSPPRFVQSGLRGAAGHEAAAQLPGAAVNVPVYPADIVHEVAIFKLVQQVVEPQNRVAVHAICGKQVHDCPHPIFKGGGEAKIGGAVAYVCGEVEVV
jgi:hypothetical protein